ncbi:isocitrate lyase/PEP mutase family protein [Lacisediminihabitans profunda]|uniref:Isocitrate lyase/phosphoenolpyruvate mutase family protein n=1 Tax=Lacisediminihabitans profunda TaxID=2594790 RepID=A0A5C8UMK6_9MICO|nr:isocitrate lyase/phosphoenolpyruvate mutase family protein [Lacisediminihabitans profunda]TXN28615.1 isocitrate lyase/phosphoenolpyruvate mutase family protein [Lacisediminihabitans profunda]
MTSTADKAALLASLHIPGDPLIVTNVWDAVTARVVAQARGVKALATASHAVSFVHGVPDNEGLTVQQALETARLIAGAVDIPVSVDFEKGYAPDAAGVRANVARLIEAGAAGLNIEDSLESASGPLREPADAASRVAAARRAAEDAGVPLAINARVDSLVSKPADWAGAMDRANRYLDAGATSVFVLRLPTEGLVERAVRDVNGPVAVIADPNSVPLRRLAELGIARVSFGPGTLGLTLAHLQRAAATLTALGDYPEELGFKY